MTHLSRGARMGFDGESSHPLRSLRTRGYDYTMGKAKEFDLVKPVPVIDEEDGETLAAIDEGVRDANSGRTSTIEKVRKLLPQWITESSSRKGR